MSNPILWSLAFAVMLGFLIRAWWRNTVIRKSMNLSDEIVRLLTKRELIWLQRGLKEYLGTTEGATLTGDARVTARVALFDELLQGFQDRLDHTRYTRALRATGLQQMPLTDDAESDAWFAEVRRMVDEAVALHRLRSSGSPSSSCGLQPPAEPS